MKSMPYRLLAVLLVAFPALLCADQTGETLYMKHCKKCHAEDGSGQTPMGKRFQVADYREAAVQEAISNEAIRDAIVSGKVNEDGKRTMLAFGKRLSEEEVEQIIAYFRSLQTE